MVSAISGFQVWLGVLKYTTRIGSDEMEYADR
jgi:hypothetical protein